MGKIEKVTIGLPVDVADAVRRAVAAGEFSTLEDAIVEAVKRWRDDQSAPNVEDGELARLWDEGLNSGAGRFSSIEAIIAEAEARARSRA